MAECLLLSWQKKVKIKIEDNQQEVIFFSFQTHNIILVKTFKNTKAAQEEEEPVEEQPIQRISSRSRKIKKLGEEFDTSDWRKGRMTQNGKTILASKKNWTNFLFNPT